MSRYLENCLPFEQAGDEEMMDTSMISDYDNDFYTGMKRKRRLELSSDNGDMDCDGEASCNTPKRNTFGNNFEEMNSPSAGQFLVKTFQSPMVADCSSAKRKRMVGFENILPSPPTSPVTSFCRGFKIGRRIPDKSQNVRTDPKLEEKQPTKKYLPFQKNLSLDELNLRRKNLKSEDGVVNKFKKYRSQVDSIKKYLDEEDENANLIADFSASYILPVLQDGKHSDLKAISHQTLTDVLLGKYDNVLDSCTIIDCRYPYEYEGGHIMGARNFYTKDSILSEFILSNAGLCTGNQKKNILVFHCEFSSERGPKMCRFLRNKDREINENNYPHLFYPEIYLLENGYKEFFHNHIDLCYPASYKPMLHEDNSKDLAKFKSQTKPRIEKIERRSDNKPAARTSLMARGIVGRKWETIDEDVICQPLN
ncbi:hypothetical protein HELRODRAFT_101296 [Helobdella robusta]|uniref:M-phase inducer phosphatase n=1 Tax=Helobdella robusta TaxID=6412 RepID=Q25122_HELRO|nr:hypothetical protein HELRODRAFT_101296 [Helobdella robusta]AAC46909.1 Hro-Cdc25 [Helobdella robusta]ESO00019.1 hypothetical protein HELRODRAFT_101296 [Helobdella robusta]